MGDFQIVTRKNKCRKKIKSKCLQTSDAQAAEDFDVVKCKVQLEKIKNELKCSEFCKKFFDQLQSLSKKEERGHSFQEIVVYGIGSISNSVIAKYQLALVLLTIEKLKVKCYVYDPVLVQKEKSIIEEHGLCLIGHNEECKRVAYVPTLFLMLHCGKAMYNNLLWKNWESKFMKNVCIIGNSFSSYDERLPSRTFHETAKYIKQILPYTLEINIENSFEHNDIFNDTAMHTFPANFLTQIPKELWNDNCEPSPTVDDTEIVRNI